MLFDDPAKRYPSLVQALNVLVRRPAKSEPVGVVVLAILAFLVFFAPRVLAFNWAMAILLVAVACVGAVLVRKHRRASRPSARMEEASQVAQHMGILISKRRLHRDLDTGSLTLLDECARQWLRARDSLESPIWKSSTAPAQYRAVRDQASTAVDDAMVDVMLHYRDVLPMDVSNRHALDYVDEALENIVRTPFSRRDERFPPAAFEHVRGIADRLRAFAEESERLVAQLKADPLADAEPVGHTTLDETLADLRALRDAEDELRQDLRG